QTVAGPVAVERLMRLVVELVSVLVVEVVAHVRVLLILQADKVAGVAVCPGGVLTGRVEVVLIGRFGRENLGATVVVFSGADGAEFCDQPWVVDERGPVSVGGGA